MGIKLIVGAGGTRQEGWVSTEHDQLDIRNRDSWPGWVQPGTVDAVLSEHVLEHLYSDEAEQAARNIYAMLARGGYWRIAVPDANNPDPKYQEFSRPNGPGQSRLRFWWYGNEPDHKVHYDVESLSLLLRSAGFMVQPLEWFDGAGLFHRRRWCRCDGNVKRSADSPYLYLNYLWADCWNLSLLVDAVKV